MATVALPSQHPPIGRVSLTSLLDTATISVMGSDHLAQDRSSHDGSPSAVSDARAAQAHSLFDASETRFLTDSLSSADTFDPFTIGAPGFKVPSVLPPNLGGMGGPPRTSSQVPTASNAPSYDASLSVSAAAGPSNYYSMPSTSTQAHPSRSSMGLAGQNWEKAAHRPSLFDPQWLTATAAANGGNNNGSAEKESLSGTDRRGRGGDAGGASSAGDGSGSGSNTPVGSGQRGGAYGKDRAWQLAQLEALQAERDKYLAHTRSEGGSQQHNAQSTPAQSHPFYQLSAAQHPRYVGDASDGVPDYPPGPHGQAYAAALARYGVQPPSSNLSATSSAPAVHPAQAAMPPFPVGAHYPPRPGGGPSAISTHPNYYHPQTSASAQHMWPQYSGAQASTLGMLGLSFPSTHSFPAAPGHAGPSGVPHYQSPQTGIQSGDLNATHGASDWNISGAARGSHAAIVRASVDSADAGGGQARGRKSEVKGSQKDEKSSDSFAKRAQAFLESSPSRAAAPAPMPPPVSIDVEKGLSAIPVALHTTFLSASFEKLQPHLEMLREQRRAGLLKKSDPKRLGGSTEADADAEGVSSGKAGGAAAAAAAKKEKGAPHVLLTDAEKKANHIASEQKRRANIRKGYEMLCDLVPNLREALGAEASTAESGKDGTSMETDQAAPAAPAASKRKEGWEVGGEKIDGRAGPRSEAIVLHETVEYVRQRLEEHQALVVRQQAARKAVAARYGLDISIPAGQAGKSEDQGSASAGKSKAKKAKASAG